MRTCRACACCSAPIATEPVLDVLLAAGLTWAAHSSVAIVLLVMSFAAKGVVPPRGRVCAGARRQSRHRDQSAAGRRRRRRSGGEAVPIGNLLNRAVGVVVGLALPAGDRAAGWSRSCRTMRALVADFHTGFNLCWRSLFLPLLSRSPRCCAAGCRPVSIRPTRRSRSISIPPRARSPVVALGGAAREALRLADVLDACCTARATRWSTATASRSRDQAARRRARQTEHRDQVLSDLARPRGDERGRPSPRSRIS